MEEVMAKSKKYKAEKQHQREEDLNETEALDNQFKALMEGRLMAGRLSTPPPPPPSPDGKTGRGFDRKITTAITASLRSLDRIVHCKPGCICLQAMQSSTEASEANTVRLQHSALQLFAVAQS